MKDTSKQKSIQVDKADKNLHGTWLSVSKEGSTILDIQDSNHLSFYGFSKDVDTSFFLHKGHSFYLYKSNGTMGFWNDSFIWVKLKDVRFDYIVRGDTLVNHDKMGEQGFLVRAYTDDEKYFQVFDSSALIGELTYINKVGDKEFFVIKNNDIEYQVTSIGSDSAENKRFSEFATIGDSIYKLPYQKTFTLIKKVNKKRLSFRFLNRQ